MRSLAWVWLAIGVLSPGCGDDAAPLDGGTDATARRDATSDAPRDTGVSRDSGEDGGPGLPDGALDAPASDAPDTDSGAPWVRPRYDVTVWPAGDLRELSSPFGPRLRASTGFMYDFHRGIDIPGALGSPIVAVADGEVHGVYREGDPASPYPNGGNVVVLRHDADIPIPFHSTEQTRYWSVYMHLDTIDGSMTSGAVVRPGDSVGTLGQSGTTTFNHLHFEIRVGTQCSREYQRSNPTVSCSMAFGGEHHDPHVNPLLLLDYDNADALEVAIEALDPLRVRVRSPRAELDFNRLVVASGTDTWVFDMNERLGVDPDDIDNPVYGGFDVRPERFRADTSYYEIVFELAALAGYDRIEALDMWGHGPVR